MLLGWQAFTGVTLSSSVNPPRSRESLPSKRKRSTLIGNGINTCDMTESSKNFHTVMMQSCYGVSTVMCHYRKMAGIAPL